MEFDGLEEEISIKTYHLTIEILFQYKVAMRIQGFLLVVMVTAIAALLCNKCQDIQITQGGILYDRNSSKQCATPKQWKCPRERTRYLDLLTYNLVDFSSSEVTKLMYR